VTVEDWLACEVPSGSTQTAKASTIPSVLRSFTRLGYGPRERRSSVQKSSREMSDSQLTSIARLEDRWSTLKERL
jgi:hypothetical protein